MSWDELLEEALVAGLTVEGFWDLDPHETHIAIRAYHRRMSYEDDALAWYTHILFNTQVEKKKDAKKPAELKRLPPLGKSGDRDSEEPSDEGDQRKRTEAEEREAFRRLKENRRRHNARQRAKR